MKFFYIQIVLSAKFPQLAGMMVQCTLFLNYLRTLRVLHTSPNGTVFDNFVTCGYVILYQFFSILTLFHSFI